MSRILRRPMFRGGPVDSRGTGITSGLMDGGRVGYSNGGDILAKNTGITYKGPPRTFAEIQAANQLQRSGTLFTEDFIKDKFKDFKGNFLQTGEETEEVVSPEDFNFSDVSFFLDEKNRDTADLLRENPEEAYNLFKTGKLGGTNYATAQASQKALAKKGGVDVDFGNNKTEEKKLTPDQERIALLEKQLKDLENDKTNEASTEIDTKEMIKMLGGDKARRRDLSDMLAGASAAFLGTGDVKEGLAEFMKQQATSGPSRLEKIEQAAATLDIKDKLAERQSGRDLSKLLGIESAKIGMRTSAANPKNLDWAGKKAYYADVLKTGSLKSNEVIRASIMATASEDGKDVFTTTNPEVVTSPDKFNVGLYVIDGGEKGKEVIEIKEDENGIKTAIPRDEFVI